MGAARATGVSQPTLGRHIAELEEQLKLVLFERTGRGLQPTAQALSLAEAAQAMQVRGPKARCVEFEGVGHAPTLIAADQVAVVQNFLLAAPVAESALAG